MRSLSPAYISDVYFVIVLSNSNELEKKNSSTRATGFGGKKDKLKLCKCTLAFMYINRGHYPRLSTHDGLGGRFEPKEKAF